MSYEHIIEKIKKDKIIVIVRGVSQEKILSVSQALYDGGIRLMEITYDHTNANCLEETTTAIRLIASNFPEMYVGAGTVLTTQEVQAAREAGASFIISPDTNEDVIKITRELGMVSMPGALSPSEIVKAYEAGASVVKVFPCSSLGLSYLKALRAPLRHIPMAAVGGVDTENMADYYAAGVCCFGIGGNLVNKDLINTENYDRLRNLAREYTEIAKAL